MKRITILMLAALLCLTSSAQNGGEVWRYDGSSGKWFQPTRDLPSTEKPTKGERNKQVKLKKIKAKTLKKKACEECDKEDNAALELTDSVISVPKTDALVTNYSSVFYQKPSIPSFGNVEVNTNYKPWNVYGLVRTNLVADALLIPNIGGEITVGKNWSLGADFYLQWLKDRDKDRFYQTYILDVDARYWWGRQHRQRQLSGWHFGPYLQAVTWDWENGHKGYQSRMFFWTFAVGGELGYNLPLGKKKRWGLDFSLGLGYLHTKYNVYNPGHNRKYYFDHRECRNLFGPTKIGVSLNYLIK